MKRIIWLMVIIMSFGLVTGCSGNNGDGDSLSFVEFDDEVRTDNETSNNTVSSSSGAFDDYLRPQIVPESETFKLGAIARDLSAESLNRADHQLRVECAHRGWEYIPVYYENEANYNDAFMSLLNQGVHAIALINPMSVETHTDMYETARNQGIGVYSTMGSVDKGIITDIGIPGSVATMELLYRIGIDYNWDLDMAVLRCDSQMASSERMFPVIGYLEGNFRPEMNLVVTDDISALLTSLGSSTMAGQEMARTWLQKYSNEIDCIFAYGDNAAMGAAEVIIANGDSTGETCFTVGIDGGKQSWSYIRDNAPLKYSYAQPIELFSHQIAELVEQIQVIGLNPGDAGCILDRSGNAIYTNGSIVTIHNVPSIGSSIHEAFNYYDPAETGEKAWWRWNDGPGIYLVEAYEG